MKRRFQLETAFGTIRQLTPIEREHLPDQLWDDHEGSIAEAVLDEDRAFYGAFTDHGELLGLADRQKNGALGGMRRMLFCNGIYVNPAYAGSAARVEREFDAFLGEVARSEGLQYVPLTKKTIIGMSTSE